jgi:hypothetical protein
MSNEEEGILAFTGYFSSISELACALFCNFLKTPLLCAVLNPCQYRTVQKETGDVEINEENRPLGTEN